MKPHKWTAEQKGFMAEFVPGHSHQEILDAVNENFSLNLALTQIKSYIKNNHLNTGRTGHFKKGHQPANKGKNHPSRGRTIETQFKSGSMPHNHLPVGSEVLNTDGYWQVKIADPGVWKLKHRLIWEQLHGSIPKGSVVIFADQDRNNFAEENLILITRQQLVRMNQNGLIKADQGATKTGAIIAELLIKTVQASKRIRR